MEIIRYCGVALVGVSSILVLRQSKSDWLPYLRVALSLVLFFLTFSAAQPLFQSIQSLTGSEFFGESVKILLRGLCIGIITDTAASVCRDCGEESAASGLEFAGKVEILLLCLPLISQLLTLSEELFSNL